MSTQYTAEDIQILEGQKGVLLGWPSLSFLGAHPSSLAGVSMRWVGKLPGSGQERTDFSRVNYEIKWN